jgi:hypothetical protein
VRYVAGGPSGTGSEDGATPEPWMRYFDVASSLRLFALSREPLAWLAHHRDNRRRIRYLDATECLKSVPLV